MERHDLLIPEIGVHTKNWTSVITITEELSTLDCRNGEKLKRYIFTDNEGNEIAATVYGRDVLTIGQVLEHLKVFEITNARVQSVEPIYQILKHSIQWRLQQDTLIRPMPHINPNLRYFLDSLTPYGLINESTKESNTNVDILGVIINADARQSNPGRNDVHRFIFVNTEMRPIAVSVWDPVLSFYNTSLTEVVQRSSVVVAKRLRVTTFDGISLSTKNLSSLTFNPPVQEAANLKSWFLSLNKSDVEQLRDMKSINTSRELVNKGAMTIHSIYDVLNAAEAGDYWVKGLIQISDEDQKLFYIGCSNCHTKINAPEGVRYPCCVCKKDVVATVRAIVAMYITDQMSTIKVIAMGEVAEKILHTTAVDIARISHLGQTCEVESVNSEFKDKIFLIQLRRTHGKRPTDQRRLLLISYFDQTESALGGQSSSQGEYSSSNTLSPDAFHTNKSTDFSLSPLKRQLSQVTLQSDVKLKRQLILMPNEEKPNQEDMQDDEQNDVQPQT